MDKAPKNNDSKLTIIVDPPELSNHSSSISSDISDYEFERKNESLSVPMLTLRISGKSERIEQRFCIITDRFCVSLAKFIQEMSSPTTRSSIIISKKNKRTKRFDAFVCIVSDFNDLMFETAALIQQSLIAMYRIFLNKNIEEVVTFFEKINEILSFFVEKRIFDKLNEIKQAVQDHHKKYNAVLDKIETINSVVMKILNFTIIISSIFIPPTAIMSNILREVSETVRSCLIDERKELDQEVLIDFDKISSSLMDVRFRAELYNKIDRDTIYQCLQDKDAEELLIKIEEIQSDYVAILVAMTSLRSEIAGYKQKKKSLMFFLF
jgi:hypothetical protein